MHHKSTTYLVRPCTRTFFLLFLFLYISPFVSPPASPNQFLTDLMEPKNKSECSVSLCLTFSRWYFNYCAPTSKSNCPRNLTRISYGQYFASMIFSIIFRQMFMRVMSKVKTVLALNRPELFWRAFIKLHRASSIHLQHRLPHSVYNPFTFAVLFFESALRPCQLALRPLSILRPPSGLLSTYSSSNVLTNAAVSLF